MMGPSQFPRLLIHDLATGEPGGVRLGPWPAGSSALLTPGG
jgi:hypothetical protein